MTDATTDRVQERHDAKALLSLAARMYRRMGSHQDADRVMVAWLAIDGEERVAQEATRS